MRLILFLAFLMTSQAYAAEQQSFNQNRAYIGGGLNFNSVGASGNSTGIQVLAGYELDVLINNDIKAAVEVGYMDTGNFDNFGFRGSRSAEGVWVAVPFRVAVNNRLDALMRVGVDFGDDDGAMVGAGMGYNFSKKAALRTEYVVRDNINSFQSNVLFRL